MEFWKKKNSNIKINEHPSNSSRVLPCGRTKRWTDGKTDR